MAAESNLPAPVLAADAQAGEAVSLARKMGEAYEQHMTWLRDKAKLDFDEADARARGLQDTDEDRQRILDKPADQVMWGDINHLARHDADLARQRWESVKEVAWNELMSGQRAAECLDYHSQPLGRAQFLAIREALIEEWQPRGGMELILIDTLATAQDSYLYWLSRLHQEAETKGSTQDHKLKKDGYWQPPRIEVAAALDQSAAMCDRFNRLFLRTLRALRDLRRYTPAVVVQHAGQVNVGAQQVNVSNQS